MTWARQTSARPSTGQFSAPLVPRWTGDQLTCKKLDPAPTFYLTLRTNSVQRRFQRNHVRDFTGHERREQRV